MSDRTYEHDPLCDDDGWDHHGPCILEPAADVVETYDDGTVTGDGLLCELVGDDNLLLTITSEGVAHTFTRHQVGFLKAAVAAYEAHNGVTS